MPGDADGVGGTAAALALGLGPETAWAWAGTTIMSIAGFTHLSGSTGMEIPVPHRDMLCGICSQKLPDRLSTKQPNPIDSHAHARLKRDQIHATFLIPERRRVSHDPPKQNLLFTRISRVGTDARVRADSGRLYRQL